MSVQPQPDALECLELFHGLTPAQLDWMALRLRSRTVPPGTNLIAIEQPGEVVFFILSGTVKVHIEQAGGNDVVLAFLGRGDTVGEMSLLDSAGRSASVETLEETTLLWMDRRSFQESLQQIPPLSLNLVRLLSARVRLANEQIQTLAALDVYGRVARQLLAFVDKYGLASGPGAVRIPIRLTQGDIADLVGASRKRVNQVMVSFKNQGFISVDANGQVIVHNRGALARLC